MPPMVMRRKSKNHFFPHLGVKGSKVFLLQGGGEVDLLSPLLPPRRSLSGERSDDNRDSGTSNSSGGQEVVEDAVARNDNNSLYASSEDSDPDQEVDEDLGIFDLERDTEDENNGVNYRVLGQVADQSQVDGDRYQQQQRKYKEEWNALTDPLTQMKVKCKPPKQQGIDIGSRIQERRGLKRKGYVVDKVEHSSPWAIRFDGASQDENDLEYLTSHQIKRLKDTRVFEWKAVKYSVPDDPVVPFQDHGCVGFDFHEFSAEKIDIDNKDENYSYPFLKLFQHLWPGKLVKMKA